MLFILLLKKFLNLNLDKAIYFKLPTEAASCNFSKTAVLFPGDPIFINLAGFVVFYEQLQFSNST